MDATDVYQSQWLKASDVGDKRIAVEIIDVKRVSTGDNEDKLEVRFREVTKTLLLNKTNATNLIEAFGKETDDWKGKTVELYTVRVSFQGKEVPAVRINAEVN